MRKITSFLVVTMLMLVSVTVVAEDFHTPTVLEQPVTTFSVTVPSVLPVTVSEDGRVVTSTTASILNNGFGPVEVKGISVSTTGGWSIVLNNKDFSKGKVGSKEFSLEINNMHVPTHGVVPVEEGSWIINGNSSSPFTYGARVAPQKTALIKESIAEVVFTVDWLEDSGSTGGNTLPPGYVMASDDDFFFQGGVWKYIGTEKKVAVPHIIKGNPMTSYAGMFMNTEVEAVYSDNPNITDMTMMFYSNSAPSLNLTYLNTSNVVNMGGMFQSAFAQSINLGTIDTSNVKNMSSMFENSKATSININVLNTSGVTTMDSMFAGTSATSLDLTGFNTSNVESMLEMFAGNKAESLDLSGFNTSKVTDTGGMFSGSNSTTINLSSLDTSKVTNMRDMFRKSKVINLDLSNFRTPNVTTMQGMFANSEILSLDVSGFNTSKVTKMDNMFEISKITTLDLSSFTVEANPSTNRMFAESSLQTLYLGSVEIEQHIRQGNGAALSGVTVEIR